MAYIYKITNQINQKAYIGKTEYTNPIKRWQEHKRESSKTRNNHRAIYRAINKYGIENFIFEILEETLNPNEREQYYIQYYNTYHNGYNETLGGDGAVYLQLPEQDICKYYLNNQHNLKQTALYFKHDTETIKRILYKYNIPIQAGSETTRLISQKAVAKIDKNTNEILEIFESVSAAEKAVNGSKHIGSVCQGKRKSANGFKWAYII